LQKYVNNVFIPGMARQKAKRKRYQRRAGLIAAAETLGVTYSHLRRCISGERKSRSLLSRYRELKSTQSNQT
jgi:hypothetical protein